MFFIKIIINDSTNLTMKTVSQIEGLIQQNLANVPRTTELSRELRTLHELLWYLKSNPKPESIRRQERVLSQIIDAKERGYRYWKLYCVPDHIDDSNPR